MAGKHGHEVVETLRVLQTAHHPAQHRQSRAPALMPP
jgi:hypothetical protein